MFYVSTYWDACSISNILSILSQYVLVDRKLSFVKDPVGTAPFQPLGNFRFNSSEVLLRNGEKSEKRFPHLTSC